MIEKDEFITLLEEVREQEHDGEWSLDAEFAAILAKKRELEWAREIIKKSHQKRSNKNDQ